MKKYKIISPPFTLEFRNMSKKELVDYYNWYMNSIPERINILIKYVKSTPGYENWEPDYTPHSLNLSGKWFAEQVETRKRTYEEKEEIYSQGPEWFKTVDISDDELTNKTFSLAIDIGMYVSQVFLKNNPSLGWKHIIKGRKDFIDYGQPVLEGFEFDVYFNPVDMMVTLAYSLEDKSSGPDGLREIYDIWQLKIKKDTEKNK